MNEIGQKDRKTRKLLTVHLLHSIFCIDGFYLPKKNGGRGLTSIDDRSINTGIQKLYIEEERKNNSFSSGK